MGLPVLSDSLQGYLADISRYPVLSQEEELKVAQRYYKLRRLEDAHVLVTSNLRYVVKIAMEFRNYGLKLADLVQEGNIGLMVAVKKFNPFKGYRLITYATWWIRSFIQEFILKSKGIVKRGAKALKKRLFYRNALAAPPAPDDLSLESGSGDNTVEATDLSLNAALPDNRASHMDMLADEGPGPMEAVSEHQASAIVKRDVTSALALLSDKERLVIEERVMAEEPQSLQSIGERLGLTRERVRQIESQALRKLKKTLEGAHELLPAGA